MTLTQPRPLSPPRAKSQAASQPANLTKAKRASQHSTVITRVVVVKTSDDDIKRKPAIFILCATRVKDM